MKTLSGIIILVFLSVSLLQGAAFEKVAKFRATQVHISSEKPLTRGNNRLNFEVSDDKYKNATMQVKIFMPAMPGMPYMETISDAKSLGDGKFTTNSSFPMGGTWQVHIFLTPKDGKKVRIKTSMNI